MLKEHLNDTFDEIGLSTHQRSKLWQLLGRLRSNPALWQAFKTIDPNQHVDQPQPLSTIVPEATLFFDDLEDEGGAADEGPKDGTDMAKGDEPELTMDLFFDNVSVLDIEPSTEPTSEPPAPVETQPKLGRYADLGMLGKGGMGEVRKVKDLSLNRQLAMKIIHPEMLKNHHALSRFIEEAQIGAQLQHPNIVPVHELGTLSDGRYYFTMKEIKGREFSDFIKEVHAVSTEHVWKTAESGSSFQRLIQIFHKACETMAFSHSLRVIHRDLKPENIMIGDFGEVLVVDWGIAKVLGKEDPEIEPLIQTNRSDQKVSATRIGMVAGTPNYMSPEQAMGRIDLIDVQSDVYTLGAILYEILSGRPPYIGKTAIEIVEKVKTTNPPSLSTGGHGTYKPTEPPSAKPLDQDDATKIPPPLIAICERAMERNIADRYPSAAEMAAEVLSWLEGTQKREQALKEVEAARQQEQAAIRKEAIQLACFQEANRILLQDGITAQGGWQQWKEGMRAKMEAKQLRISHRNTLQGALVYDSELEEAHDGLAELVMSELLVAMANREHRAKALLERQLHDHLLFLSKPRQSMFAEALEQGKKADIALRRTKSRSVFIGREVEQQRLADLLQQARVVTILGMAGVGKTRLAIESAYRYRQNNQNDAVFCDLTFVKDSMGIFRTVASVLNLQLKPQEPAAQIGEALAGKGPLLLILDNVEQVGEAIVPIVQGWLTRADKLKILLTSRARLQQLDDNCIQLMPMTFLQGIRLFVQCAQALNADFALDEQKFQNIARIVQRLDSLPLAVELVAARVSTLRVSEIESRLSSCFSLASSRVRSADQRALLGALDWSYDLLTDWEKAVFSQCSIFHNGFLIDAAEEVVELSHWPAAPSVLDAIEALCDDNLILKETQDDGSIRYRMLLSIQDYAAQRMPETHLDTEPKAIAFSVFLSHRHAHHFSRYAQREYLDALDGFGKNELRQKLYAEVDNLLQAGRAGTAETASLCCIAVLKIALLKGPTLLGIQVARTVLQRDGIPPQMRLRLLLFLSKGLRSIGQLDASREIEATQHEIMASLLREGGISRHILSVGDNVLALSEQQHELALLQASLLIEQGDLECDLCAFDLSHEHYHEALTIYQRLDDRNEMTKVYNNIGILYGKQNKMSKALPYFEKALENARTTENTLIQGRVLSNLATILVSQRRLGEAEESYREAIKCHKSTGNKQDEGKSLGGLANVLRKEGKYNEAIVYHKRALNIATKLGNRSTSAANMSNMGDTYLCLNDPTDALMWYQKALLIHQEIGHKVHEGITLGSIANVFELMEQWAEAKDYFQQAIDVCAEISHPAMHTYRTSLALLLAKENEFSRAMDLLEKSKDGLKRFPFQHATSLCKQTKVYLLANMPEEARIALNQANDLIQTHGFSNAQLAQDISDLSAEIAQLEHQ